MNHGHIDAILASLNQVILGKDHAVKLALSCLLARGHLLIEDLPGVGKTTLAHALAATLGLKFQRVQFTSDMLPADIIGVSIFDRELQRFTLHRGPVFTQLLLADEVNRASPRTQSALLEVMEEQQVSIDGETYPLTSPFFVIATQNPTHQIGTFPLPESQLDRFLMRISLGYPNTNAERALLKGDDRRQLLQQLQPVIEPATLLNLQHTVQMQTVSDALIDYVQALLSHTRHSGQFQNGLSPRAGLGLLHAAQAWSFISGRDYVMPEDVQAVLPNVIGHRLQSGRSAMQPDWVQSLVDAVAIP
ncbi:MoxR-like ATPase [Methylophaga frappieri]|uniref:MoxR-like ATPase n=1 Tax=Methylophaga frappieri (strain ATCC BAA-2434 / DSM 25690 / JAM7) TaxID=754477 RepID=I1YFX3_METFJ|nr:MoxR family ATPase [Methylophaga frappieri]AFJ01816.1 MoxR-like ATPase [Methylophaga frappieri]